jgi:Ankyrin repeats (3 copies)
MSRTQSTLSSLAVIVCGLVLHGCQQSTLNVLGDDSTNKSFQTPQVLSTQSEQGTETTRKYELSSIIVLTSSSDSSPDSKNADKLMADSETKASSITNVPKYSVLVPVNTDTIVSEAGSSAFTKKRPSYHTDPASRDQQRSPTKRTRVEENWAEGFKQAIDKLEEDEEDEDVYEEAWKAIQTICEQYLALKQTFRGADNEQYTLLSYAASKGQLEVVKYLVDISKNQPSTDTEGSETTALYYAASKGYLDIVKYLIEEGIKQKRDSTNTHMDIMQNSLCYAAAGRQELGNKEIIAYLAEEQGVELHTRLDNGSSALGLAVASCNLAVVEYWVEYYTASNKGYDKWNDEIMKLTEDALNLAKHDYKQKTGKSGPELYIVRLLSEFLESKSDKKQSNNVITT